MPRPTSLPEPWRSLADKLGGVQALADVLLCDPRSIHRWACGERKPDRRSAEWIRAAFRQAGFEPPI